MDCIFCKIISGELPCTKVYEDDEFLAFNDINPQAPVHILVIPKEHREMLSDYGPNDEGLLGRLLAVTTEIARQQKLDHYRTVINCGSDAGQMVFHLHLHLVSGRKLSGQLC